MFVHEHAGVCKLDQVLLVEQDSMGWTPLHAAAAQGQTSFVLNYHINPSSCLTNTPTFYVDQVTPPLIYLYYLH